MSADAPERLYVNIKKREFIFWGQKTKNAGGIEMQKFALWNGG